MDKWGKLAEIMTEAVEKDDETTGLRTAMAFAMEIGRALEDIGQSFDRIATALERASEKSPIEWKQ